MLRRLLNKGGWKQISVAFLFAISAVYSSLAYSSDSEKPFPDAVEGNKKPKLNFKLLHLKPNVWIKLTQGNDGGWHRQEHAGLAHDSKRGTLLIFGSDTHGIDWDNEIHEFDPVTERWTTHYKRSGKETYRADKAGNAIAGTDRTLPWAMHTFNNVIYDPELDAVVVTGVPQHNPMFGKVQNVKMHPTWLYDLKTRAWRIFYNSGKESPHFFASASVYDPDRRVIVAYKKEGVWEIGPERKEWKKATAESHHEIHFMMAYDTRHRKIAVFGDYQPSNDVWIYTPGSRPGDEGRWEKKVPAGDECPKGRHFPVAFDTDNGVFLLVPDYWHYVQDAGNNKIVRTKSSTFVYDPEDNRYYKLPQADMEPLGMNYMMAYDEFHHVFLLVTGDSESPPTVWALKLDTKALRLSDDKTP
jgi:hypothetical protein